MTTLTQQYRLRTNDDNDGATCFLTPSQALGFDLPDPVLAYPGRGRVTRFVSVQKDAITAIEKV